MSVDDKMMERIKKLLALSSSDNANESSLALSKAQALMAQHNLTMGALHRPEVDEIKMNSKVSISVVKDWEAGLMNLVAKAFGCQLLWQKGFSAAWQSKELRDKCGWGKFILIGPKHQLPIAQWTAEVLTDRLLKARTTFSKGLTGSPAAKAASADAFCLGWVSSVGRAVHKMANSPEIDEAIAERMGNLGENAKRKSAGNDYDATLAGMEAGKGEAFHRPMTGEDAALQIK